MKAITLRIPRIEIKPWRRVTVHTRHCRRVWKESLRVAWHLVFNAPKLEIEQGPGLPTLPASKNEARDRYIA